MLPAACSPHDGKTHPALEAAMHLLSAGGRSALRWRHSLLLGSAAAVVAAMVPAVPVLANPTDTPPVMLVAAKAAAPVVPMVTGGQVSVTPGAGNAGVL